MPDLEHYQSSGKSSQDGFFTEPEKPNASSFIHERKPSIKGTNEEPTTGLQPAPLSLVAVMEPDANNHQDNASTLEQSYQKNDLARDNLIVAAVKDVKLTIQGRESEEIDKEEVFHANGPEKARDSKCNNVPLASNHGKFAHDKGAHGDSADGIAEGFIVKAEADQTENTVTPSVGAAGPKSTASVAEVIHSASSLPPHLRPNFQAPLQPSYGIRDSKHAIASARSTSPPNYQQDPRHRQFPHWTSSPRPHAPPCSFRHDMVDHGGAARMHAQLLSLTTKLEKERQTNMAMRKTIEAEQQEKSSAAFASMLSNLLRSQEEALAIKARAEAKERDLQVCSKRIEQLEIYLAVGQKQLFLQLHQEGLDSLGSLDAATHEHIRRDAFLAAEKRYADHIGALNIRTERLRLREEAQLLREAQYKASICHALEAEAPCERETALSSARAEEIAEREYNRGFAAGKEAGLRSARETAFLEGYAACHGALAAVDALRRGRIASDDPKLAFLFDIGNPENLTARGIEIGQMMNKTRRVRETDGIVGGEEEVSVDPINGQHPSSASASASASAFTFSSSCSPSPTNNKSLPPAPKAVATKPQYKTPPARLTLAAELRDTPAPTYNGQIILANHSASSSFSSSSCPDAAASASASASSPRVHKTGRLADVGPDLIDLN